MSTKSVCIMAGGKSSRMGTDKSFVEILGKPLIEHILERVAALGDVFIVTNRPADYAYLGLPVHTDVIPDKGPLGGIYTALHHSQTDYTLVIACDMPFIPPALLHYMMSLCDGEVEVIVPRVEKYPEGLHAIYHKRCLDPIHASLEADRLKVITFYGKVKVQYLDEPDYQPYDPDGLAFMNVNTPEELQQARDLASQKRKSHES